MQLDEVMAKIRPPAIIPYHGTPIVETMVRAKEDLKDAAGFKTLVVLTDGGESEVTPREKIPEILRKEFRDTRIMINMVCFKANADDQKEAQQQFKDVLENGLEVPGKFQLVNDVPALAQKLSESIARNLTYRVDKFEHVPAESERRPGPGPRGSQRIARQPVELRPRRHLGRLAPRPGRRPLPSWSSTRSRSAPRSC